jgi:hypothetical protein
LLAHLTFERLEDAVETLAFEMAVEFRLLFGAATLNDAYATIDAEFEDVLLVVLEQHLAEEGQQRVIAFADPVAVEHVAIEHEYRRLAGQVFLAQGLGPNRQGWPAVAAGAHAGTRAPAPAVAHDIVAHHIDLPVVSVCTLRARFISSSCWRAVIAPLLCRSRRA